MYLKISPDPNTPNQYSVAMEVAQRLDKYLHWSYVSAQILHSWLFWDEKVDRLASKGSGML